MLPVLQMWPDFTSGSFETFFISVSRFHSDTLMCVWCQTHGGSLTHALDLEILASGIFSFTFSVLSLWNSEIFQFSFAPI